MKKLLPLLFLIPVVALAQPDATIKDIVRSVGPYEISTLEAQNSVIHLYVPTDSYGVVGMTGGDTFVEAVENMKDFDLDMSEDSRSVFLQNSLKPGVSTTMVLTTACGISVSIYMHSVSNTGPEEKVAPKLSLTSSPCD